MKFISKSILSVAALLILSALSTNAFGQNNTNTNAPRGGAVVPPAPVQIGPPVAPLDPQGNWPVKIFELKNLNGFEMSSILKIFRAEVSYSTLSTGAGASRQILSVRAPAEIMPAIEDTISRFDVAPPPQPKAATRNIEVSVHVVGAYEGNGVSACATCAIPESLKPVITQLQKSFSYKSYQLLDTQLYRQINRNSLVSTNSLPGMNDASANYLISWRMILAANDKPTTVLLSGFKFSATVTLKPEGSATPKPVSMGFDNEVEIPLDQQVVIGKTTVGNNALFLVLRAKILE